MEEYAIVFNQNITFTPESGHFTFSIFSAKSGSVGDPAQHGYIVNVTDTVSNMVSLISLMK